MSCSRTFRPMDAMALLSAEQRAEVQQIRQGPRPSGLRARFRYEHLTRESQMMVARTVAIAEDLRHAAVPQVVILGAGLDGRAWRMREIGTSIVFEVDHPDSQHQKLQRVASLTSAAREVRFVPLDFRLDNLAHANEIESTLRVVRDRSAAGSRLVVAYHQPAWMLLLLKLIVGTAHFPPLLLNFQQSLATPRV